MTQNNITIHITLLVLLLVGFFGLMFLSTSNRSIETSYDFSKEIEVTSINYNSIKIGELSVKNSGLIASKIPLQSYKGCIFETAEYNYGFDVGYAGSTTNYNDFTGYSPKQFVEVGGNEEKTYSMVLNGFYPNAKYDEKGVLIIENKTKTYDLYLFEVSSQDYNYYEYCLNAEKANAVKTIKLIVTNE